MGTYQDHFIVQQAAKRVLNALGPTLTSFDSETTIAARAADLLSAEGITNTWYYDCPAFVLLGSRSCLSISGRDYVPSLEQVGDFNLITVDLSPLLNGAWGDCARTFAVEDGAFMQTPTACEFSDGLAAEAALHAAMLTFVEPTTTFEELSAFGNSELRRLGFENLDLHGNLGHSIESQRESRVYIETGNRRPLGSVAFFTFEPHIGKLGSTWGFKHEDIYCFDTDRKPHAL